MAALPARSTADAALLARLHAFHLLPSQYLHPARTTPWQAEAQALGPLGEHPAVLRALHRRWSQRLLASLQGDAAQPLLDLAQPVLPLVLAEPPLFARLVRDAGAVLLGQRLRHAIVRADVLAAREAFGAEALQWVRQGAGPLHPGLADCGPWLPGTDHATAADYARAADLLGAGLLAAGWQDAPPALRQRARWKLPPEADDPALQAASGLPAPRARALCLQLLARLDPTWLSSFPATH